MKIISPEEIRNHNLCADVVDTHITRWENGTHFQNFQKKKRPFSALFFVLSDVESTYLELDENGNEINRLRCKKGDILYLPAKIRYHTFFTVNENETDPVTCTVNFNLDAGGEGVLLSRTMCFLPNKVNRLMTEDLFLLHKCTANPAACDRTHINSLYFSVLYHATCPRDAGSRGGTVKAAVQAIENEWNRNEKMERYAALCNRSLTCFYQEFKAYTGMTPTRYRNRIRINEAKSDMRNTNMTIRQIAEKTGFEDEFYFSRVFRKITGVSPSEFKKN